MLGTNALEKLGWCLSPNAVPSQNRIEAASGNAHQRIERNVKEAAEQQQSNKAFNKVTAEGYT